MIRREILPLVVVLLFAILLAGLMLLPFPDLLLGPAAEQAPDPRRAAAAQEIGKAMFYAFAAMLFLALLFGIAWGVGPGRSRVLDDRGARSKYWHWWLFIAVSLIIGGYLYWRWFPAEMLFVGDGWRRPGPFIAVFIFSMAGAAVLYRAATLLLARPHMRPSIPRGVSHPGKSQGSDSGGVGVSSGVSMSTAGEVSGELSVETNLTNEGNR